jgi:hypothetical protein
MFKSKMPNIQQNPEIMKNIMEVVAKSQAEAGGPRPPTPVDPLTGRREMKGPGMDLSSLMGGFMAPPPPSNTRTKPVVEDGDNLSDIVSDVGGQEDTKEIQLSDDKKKGSKKKKGGNTIEL